MVFCEDSRVRIPCIPHLARLGYRYLWKSAYESKTLFGWEGKTSGIKNLLFDASPLSIWCALHLGYSHNAFLILLARWKTRSKISCKKMMCWDL